VTVADADDAARAGIPDDRQAALDAAHQAEYERDLLERRRSAIEAGRRKGGLAGAAMAGAMLAVSDIVEGPKKDDAPVVVEANSDPTDVDRDGVRVDLSGESGDVTVEAPALPPMPPPAPGTRRGG